MKCKRCGEEYEYLPDENQYEPCSCYGLTDEEWDFEQEALHEDTEKQYVLRTLLDYKEEI